MNSEEFLKELEKSLRGKVDEREIGRQLQYYESYIKNEINSGRTMEDVMKELGNPRLIAKTLIQTYNIKDNPINRHYSRENHREETWSDESENSRSGNVGRKIKTGIWMLIVLGIIGLGLLVIIGIIFSLLPLIIPVVAIIAGAYIIFKLVS